MSGFLSPIFVYVFTIELTKKANQTLMVNTICIYNYFEKDSSYKRNCKYFLEHGVNDAADFLFVVNGESSVSFPVDRPNVKPVIYRENTGFDFQAHTEAVRTLALDGYDYFVFINSSVKGPYTKGLRSPWQRSLTDMIQGDTKLVGTTINIFTTRNDVLEGMGLSPPYSHVQTQVFAMDRECLVFLKDKVFTDHDPNDSFHSVIYKKEVGMSQHVLRNNWNISCLAPKYRGLDYRKLKEDINPTSREGDANYVGAYFGRSLRPDELLFIKTNRDYVIEFFVENGEKRHAYNKHVVLLGVCLLLFMMYLIRG